MKPINYIKDYQRAISKAIKQHLPQARIDELMDQKMIAIRSNQSWKG